MTRVLLADDHPVVREGVRRLLAEQPDLAVVADANSGDATRAALDTHEVDVLVLDVAMPGGDFTSLMQWVRARHPGVRVVVLSAHAEEEYAERALRLGARAYVSKDRSGEELLEAIRRAAAGLRYVSETLAQRLAARLAGDAQRSGAERLSDRELDVLRRLGSGRTVKEIAAALALSPKTVSTYRERLLQKLSLDSTAQLIKYAIEHDLDE